MMEVGDVGVGGSAIIPTIHVISKAMEAERVNSSLDLLANAFTETSEARR